MAVRLCLLPAAEVLGCLTPFCECYTPADHLHTQECLTQVMVTASRRCRSLCTCISMACIVGRGAIRLQEESHLLCRSHCVA